MKLISTHTVMTSDLGVNGNLFGGRALSWLDMAAAAFAAETIKSPRLVTLKFSECVFHRPAKERDLLKIYGEVLKIGRTSISVLIEARRKDVVTEEEEPICSTSVIMVKIDDAGNPAEI